MAVHRDREAIAFSGQAKVPVITTAKVVSDSWAIAEYLEDQISRTRRCLAAERARRTLCSSTAWADAVLVGGIARFIVRDLLDVIDPKDRDYFRSSREARFGASLEAVQAGPGGPCGGVSRSAAAGPAGAPAAGLAGRRGAELCGSYHRGNADVAALRQPVRVT